MKQILMYISLSAVLALLVAGPGIGTAEEDEILYKTCFPKKETTAEKAEECKDEDCGLIVEATEEPVPLVVKSQKYSFLGATDHGVIWGSSTYRMIGDDRVRFLLYVVTPASTKVTSQDKGYVLIPESVIQTAFFSSFGEYRGSSVSVSYKAEKRAELHEEVSGGGGVLEMVDLHCSAKKLKIYDNHTLYYRTIEGLSQKSLCVELLWEKPKAPLRWQPASSVMMDILTKYYCNK